MCTVSCRVLYSRVVHHKTVQLSFLCYTAFYNMRPWFHCRPQVNSPFWICSSTLTVRTPYYTGSSVVDDQTLSSVLEFSMSVTQYSDNVKMMNYSFEKRWNSGQNTLDCVVLSKGLYSLCMSVFADSMDFKSIYFNSCVSTRVVQEIQMVTSFREASSCYKDMVRTSQLTSVTKLSHTTAWDGLEHKRGDLTH